MLAYRYKGLKEMCLEEVPEAECEGDDLLLDVVAAGICGTDLKIARGEHRLFQGRVERTLGHEFVGRVSARSARTGFVEGDLVAVAPNISCGRCFACGRGKYNACENYESVGLTMDGAFAERVRIPARAVEQGNVLRVPESMSASIAVLMEPIAAVLRGVKTLQLRPEHTVAVCGAGPIGILAVAVLSTLGVHQIIVSEVSASRRAAAVSFGATATVSPQEESFVERVRELTEGNGADAVFVATPVPLVFQESIEGTAVGGRINFFAGLPNDRGQVVVDASAIHYRELVITGSAANTTQDCRDAMKLLESDPQRYAGLISRSFSLKEINAAFDMSASGEALKVIVEI
jgi:L-iditol 2-dehydrogenase